MLSLLIAAAEEPSKVPFYFVGGALAAWAVLLAFIGLSRPSFPGSSRGQWGVIAISFVMFVAAVGTAIATS